VECPELKRIPTMETQDRLHSSASAAERAAAYLVAEGEAVSATPTPPHTSQAAPSTTTETEKGVRRINVNFSKSAYETLEQLAAQRGKSMSDVLRDAIQLERWLSDARADGWSVLLEKDGRVRELVHF
jgi:predicted DNA-binding protein